MEYYRAMSKLELHTAIRDESHKQNVKQKKPECILYYCIYRKFKNGQNEAMVTEIRRVAPFGEVFAESTGRLVNV